MVIAMLVYQLPCLVSAFTLFTEYGYHFEVEQGILFSPYSRSSTSLLSNFHLRKFQIKRPIRGRPEVTRNDQVKQVTAGRGSELNSNPSHWTSCKCPVEEPRIVKFRSPLPLARLHHTPERVRRGQTWLPGYAGRNSGCACIAMHVYA